MYKIILHLYETGYPNINKYWVVSKKLPNDFSVLTYYSLTIETETDTDGQTEKE